MTLEDRIDRASEPFKSGYNCSQSIVAAFAGMYGFTEEQALRMAVSFGGGIERMCKTCGVACGMSLFVGLEKETVDGADHGGKTANYALIQELAAEFKKRNGSLNCGELFDLKKKAPVSSEPEARTEQYYVKRPCSKMVEEVTRIWTEYSEEQKKQLLN